MRTKHKWIKPSEALPGIEFDELGNQLLNDVVVLYEVGGGYDVAIGTYRANGVFEATDYERNSSIICHVSKVIGWIPLPDFEEGVE